MICKIVLILNILPELYKGESILQDSSFIFSYQNVAISLCTGGSGGGGPGGSPPPPGPLCRLFNIGPNIGPPPGPFRSNKNGACQFFQNAGKLRE